MDKQKTPDALRRMATVVLSSGGFGRPMLPPPGMAADLARTIRTGYEKMLKDPEFIAEVNKRRYDLEPVSWDEMQNLSQEVTDQPADVIEHRKMIMTS